MQDKYKVLSKLRYPILRKKTQEHIRQKISGQLFICFQLSLDVLVYGFAIRIRFLLRQ